MIIELNANDRVPADIVVLWGSENLFVRTDQLDGETDWKLRKPIQFTQK